MCCLLFQSSQDILWHQDAQTGGTDCEGAGEDSLPWSGVSDNTVIIIIIIACYVAVLALAGGFRSRHWFHASVPFLGLIAIWKVHSASWSPLTVRRDRRTDRLPSREDPALQLSVVVCSGAISGHLCSYLKGANLHCIPLSNPCVDSVMLEGFDQTRHHSDPSFVS